MDKHISPSTKAEGVQQAGHRHRCHLCNANALIFKEQRIAVYSLPRSGLVQQLLERSIVPFPTIFSVIFEIIRSYKLLRFLLLLGWHDKSEILICPEKSEPMDWDDCVIMRLMLMNKLYEL